RINSNRRQQVPKSQRSTQTGGKKGKSGQNPHSTDYKKTFGRKNRNKFMTPKQLSYGILRALGIAALICLALYFLWLIRSVFAYLAIAFVLAMIGRPLMNLMNNKLRIPNSLGALITLSLFLFLILAFISLFISLVLNQPYRLVGNFVHLDRFEDAVSNQLKLLADSLGFLNIPF